MSNLTAAQRKALPLDSFGDPAHRLYPIVDQDDVDSAAHLIGKADDPDAVKKRIIAIAKRKGLTLPAAWKTDAKMAAEADIVFREGLIFRSGTFPDKDLTITDEDLAAMATAFTTPVDAELEHIQTAGIATFLDGKLGRLVAVWAKGAELYGRMEVPQWLDTLWEDTGRKVSVVIDRGTKHLTRIGLVLNPRIEDATVMSALATFAAARHDTPHGQNTLQRIHDLAAQSGALCTPSTNAEFVSAHERTGMQAVHDMAAEHGASCPGRGYGFSSAFAGGRHSAADRADMQQIHDLAQRQGAACTTGAAPMSHPQRSSGMRLDSLKFWRTMPRGMRDEAREQGIAVPDEDIFSAVAEEAQDAREQAHKEQLATFEAKQKEADEKLARAEQELFRATAQRLQSEAAGFADGLIMGHKLLPAEREGVIAALTQAGIDDSRHGPVSFGDGTQTSRVTQLRALYEARPAHELTKEQLDGRGNLTVVMGGKPAVSGPDALSDDELLSKTAAGREAVARKKRA